MNVTAHARRSGDWWAVTVPEIPGINTQAKRLDRVEAMVKDAAELLEGIDPDSMSVSLVVEGEFVREAEASRQLNKQSKEMALAASESMSRAAKKLSRVGLSYRDIGHLLGVSFQRAQKLAKA